MLLENHSLIISTKLNRPRAPEDLVLRPQLFERLNRLRPLTLVIAPAGYGKSALLSSWLDTANDKPSVWLSLHENDDDLNIFLTYFLAALQTRFPHVGHKTATLLTRLDNVPKRVLHATLINELNQITEAYTLTLDDYHLLKNREIHQLVAELVNHAPETLHLVIASRTDPPLPTALYRAKNLVTEIRANNLRFSLKETRAFLRNRLDEPPDERLVVEIYTRTEGWVTGLQLETLAMRRRAAAERPAGDDQPTDYIAEYLMLEALRSQPEPVQEWLLKSAVLERLCAGLCEAVCANGNDQLNGADFLKGLTAANLFVIPLDTERTWYRYHHLFANFLIQTLQKRYTPEEIGRLRREAGKWLAENGFMEEAFNQAVAAGDMAQATALIEKQWPKLLDADQWYVLQRWLDKLPSEHTRERPQLLLAQARITYFQHNLKAIPPLLRLVEARPEAELRHSLIQGEIEFFRGHQLYWNDNSQQSLTHLQKALRHIPREHALCRASAELFFTLAQHSVGQGDTAVKHLNQALCEYPLNSMRESRLLAALIFIYLLSGNLEMAGQTNQRLFQTVQRMNSLYALAWHYYLSALIKLETNQLEAALDDFRTVREMRYYISANAATDGLAGLALLYQATGQSDKAEEAVRELETFVLETGNDHFLTAAHSCRARVAVWRGDRETAVRLRQTLNFSNETRMMMYWLETPRITECRILAASDSADDWREAAEKLAQYLRKNRRAHNVMRLIELLVLQTAVYLKQRRRAEALAALEEAVRLGQPGGWIFPFLETGDALAPLLETLRGQHIIGEYAGRILRAIGQKQGGNTAVPPLAEDLTYRERDVLSLLAQEMSNREIAEQLVISPHTVKRHVASLSRKLDAKNRRQAVAKATQLGLL
ncbi:MAG TPA: hypothetical protein ENJ93_08540 [Chloroflexi bacterium]|nr:hypothetical protein [Chloroflexota bacterium]